MMKVSQKRHLAGRKEDGKGLLIGIERVYISKEKGELQHKVWKLGRMKKKIMDQQRHNEEHDQLQNKIWDPSILSSSTHG